jgi:hypothetical protein
MKAFSLAALCAVASTGVALAETAQLAGRQGLASVRDIAMRSKCASHNWKERGVAPKVYIEGVALVFARAVCHPEHEDVTIVSAAENRSANPNDALAVYEGKFAALGMKNDKDGVDTLRHSYTLLISLGMMESSGKYCEGRDVSQCFTEADSAEAGLFQTSYGAHVNSSVLGKLFDIYKNGQRQCFLEEFKDSLRCPIHKSHNPRCPNATSDVIGSGDGLEWQKLTKACPACATEYGAVVLRKNGGPHGEFNPIRKKQAEVLPECDSMLKDIQVLVEGHPEICQAM